MNQSIFFSKNICPCLFLVCYSHFLQTIKDSLLYCLQVTESSSTKMKFFLSPRFISWLSLFQFKSPYPPYFFLIIQQPPLPFTHQCHIECFHTFDSQTSFIFVFAYLTPVYPYNPIFYFSILHKFAWIPFLISKKNCNHYFF